tara:strand:+ start:298 stop:585 length:288 start_codon:yes stop_codon:yes gene_type:complete
MLPFAPQEGEEERHKSDDDFLDDEEEGEDDPEDLYYRNQNGDMDDHDEAEADRAWDEWNPKSYCMQCGMEVSLHDQLCLVCERAAFRESGANLFH